MTISTAIPRDIGAKLRHVRQMCGLSLHDVEALTGAMFKSSAVGAYERGERVIPSDRLVQLAHVYRVPVADLVPDSVALPEPESPAEDGTVNVTALMGAVGCSYRQIDYWVRSGLVEVADGIAEPGSGYQRRFTPGDVFIARVVHCLSAFGFNGEPLATAVENIRNHSPAARLVYIREDGSTDWGPGATAAIVIDLDQLRLKSTKEGADR